MKKKTWSVIFVFVAAVMMSFFGRQVYAAGTVESIVIKNMPTKTEYKVGDKLNTSGLAIRVRYSDGTTEDMTSGFDCTPQIFTEDGEQYVTVSYSGKTATYQVNVKITPKIITQPSFVTTTSNKLVSFTFKVFSKDVTYQWYIKKEGATDYTLWKGHTTSTTSAIPNATWNNMWVYCKAVDGYGNSFSSNSVKVTLTDVLGIDSQPSNVKVVLGNTAKLKLVSYGKNLTYQWYLKKAGESVWSKWKGMNSAEISFTADASLDQAKARCIVTDGENNLVVSNTATISIVGIVKITTDPYDVNVKSGEKATFKVIISSTYTVQFQWYVKKFGASDWTLWKGHTQSTTSAVANDSWNGMQVRCRVTGYGGQEVYSSAALVSIIGKLTLISSPENVTAVPNETVAFSCKAAGNCLSYQWYYRKQGASNWSLWKNHIGKITYGTANDSWNGMQVRCVIKDENAQSVTTKPATVTIGENSSSLVFLSQPKSIAVKAGNTASFAVKVQGSGLKYQWYYKKKGASSWSMWKGHTASTMTSTVNSTWDGMKVRCLVTCTTGGKAYSKVAVITLTDHPIVITSQPKNVSVKANHLTSFSVTATGEDLDYQWYYKKKGASNWSVWRMYTTQTIKPPANNTWDGMQVRCQITDAYGNKAYSNATTITILPTEEGDFRILQHPRSLLINVYRTVTFTVNANGTGMTYKWYYCKSNSNTWTLCEGKYTDSLKWGTDEAWNGAQFYCVITNGDGEQLYSDIAKITYSPNVLTITEQPENASVKKGKMVTFSVKAKGEGLRYQWYYEKETNTWATTWEKIGEPESVLQFPTHNVRKSRNVKCVITDKYGNTLDSNIATVSVLTYSDDEFRIVRQPSNVEYYHYIWSPGFEYDPDDYRFRIEAYGSDLTYQWYIRSEGASTWSKWEGATSPVSPSASATFAKKTYVYCVVTNGDGDQIYSDIVYYKETIEED